MKLFDTHTHLDFPHFSPDQKELIEQFEPCGIEKVVNVGCDRATSSASVELACSHKQIYAAVGFHPHNAEDFDASFLQGQNDKKKVVAIGEIGLDYYRNLAPKSLQKEVFQNQLEIAQEANLPVIIHNRNADKDVLEIIARYDKVRAVFHCFGSNVDFANQVIQMGHFVSFTGNITFKNADFSDVILLVPPDRYFVETDSPYLTPHPFRGKRNSPLFLHHIVQKIAEIRGETPKDVAKQTYKNGCRFFGV